MEQLKLERPLAVFDIESTGVMPQRDRIVEIAVLKIFPDGKRTEACFSLTVNHLATRRPHARDVSCAM